MNTDFSITGGGVMLPLALSRGKGEEREMPLMSSSDSVSLSKAGKEAIREGKKAGDKGETSSKAMVKLIRSCLTPDLLKGKYKKEWNPDKPKSWGHCYVASETYYHMMGGSKSGLKPYWVKHEGGTHHFLREADTGKVVDITGDQFKTTPPYDQGKAFGWLTGDKPSDRAKTLMKRVREKM